MLSCLGTTSEEERTLAYVRIKRVGGREYYQLVESRRVEGNPRQKVLVHLGSHPSVDEALKEWPKAIRRLRRAASKDREIAAMDGRKPEDSSQLRGILKRADSTDRRADDLEKNLKRLRELRKQGAV
jgi:hypothetical protein